MELQLELQMWTYNAVDKPTLKLCISILPNKINYFGNRPTTILNFNILNYYL